MRHLANQEAEEAWGDIMLIRRLARKVAQGPTLIEGLVGYAIEDIACQTTCLWLRAVPRMYDSYADKLKQLGEFSPLPSLADCLLFERLMVIEAVTRIARGGLKDGLAELGMAAAEDTALETLIGKAFDTVSPDWNVVLRDINDYYDRLEMAFRIENALQRQTKLLELQAEVEDRAEKARATVQNPLTLAQWALLPKKGSREAGEVMCSMLMSIFTPALNAVDVAATQKKNSADIVLLALQVMVHRERTGKFPESLAAMQLPKDEWNWIDPTTQKPFVYRQEGSGFALYHVGRNGEDDGGPDEEGQQTPDDFGVRLVR